MTARTNVTRTAAPFSNVAGALSLLENATARVLAKNAVFALRTLTGTPFCRMAPAAGPAVEGPDTRGRDDLSGWRGGGMDDGTLGADSVQGPSLFSL